MPSALARINVSAVEGAVVSKPMAKNITCLSGLSARELQGIRRRIDNADIHAARFVFERTAVGAGHAHHVSERSEDDAGSSAMESPSSIRPMGSTHTGQPGP